MTNTKFVQKISSKDFEAFIVINSLNKHLPLKTKYLRANHSDFITEDLFEYDHVYINNKKPIHNTLSANPTKPSNALCCQRVI